MKRCLKKSLAVLLTLATALSALTCLAMAADEDDTDDSEERPVVSVTISCDESEARPGDTIDIDYTIGPVENLTRFECEVTEPEGMNFDKLVYHGGMIEVLQDIMFGGEGEVAASGTKVQGSAYTREDAFTCEGEFYLFSARYTVADDAENGYATFGLESAQFTLYTDSGSGNADVTISSKPVEIVVVDTSELSKRLTYAEQLLSMPDLYSEHSVKVLEEAVEFAQNILDHIRDYRQTDVDDALEKLNDAIDALKPPSEELEAAIQAAEQLRESDYTADSWGNMMDALDAAKGILDKEDATEEEMNGAANALYEAIDALVPLSEDDSLAASREKLQADLEAAKALNESDYTTASWAVLQDAVQAAEEVLNNADATKEELDNADDALADAVAGLVSVRSSGTGGNTGSSGGSGTTGSGTTGGVSSPQTGDSSVLLICLAVLAAGLTGCSAVCVSKARGRKE